jgi:hypothetical protein
VEQPFQAAMTAFSRHQSKKFPNSHSLKNPFTHHVSNKINNLQMKIVRVCAILFAEIMHDGFSNTN